MATEKSTPQGETRKPVASSESTSKAMIALLRAALPAPRFREILDELQHYAAWWLETCPGEPLLDPVWTRQRWDAMDARGRQLFNDGADFHALTAPWVYVQMVDECSRRGSEG